MCTFLNYSMVIPRVFFVRPGRIGPNASGRGVLSMQGLSYGVVRVDSDNSLTSLTLQDCGQVLPGGIQLENVMFLFK